ncbi:Cubilin [Nymphon striatum]|nr:Cubilin [Nymphon striatum]
MYELLPRTELEFPGGGEGGAGGRNHSVDSSSEAELELLHQTTIVSCDVIRFSTETSRNGSFVSPEFENPLNHSRQCIYSFVGRPNERVTIEFTYFNLRGKHFECEHEYLDIYMEVKNSTDKLIDAPFGGRYCGIISPRFRISLYSTLTLGFHTEFPEVSNVYTGKYEFISADKFVVGTPVPNTKCSFTITMESEDDRTGDVISPTYPGVYPKGLKCEYTFKGRKNQRILIELMDFDVFYGGPQYYIYGLEDSQNLERVHVKLDELEISTEAKNACTNGFLRVYLRGQEERHAVEEYDHIFCGHVQNPPKLISEGPRLVLVFSSGTSKGRSFKGQFWFETYYQIPGTAAPGGACDFSYRSTKRKTFETAINNTNPVFGYMDNCKEDYVEVYEVRVNGNNTKEHLQGKYCAHTTPGPIVTDKGVHRLLVKLKSNGWKVAGGFRATYKFLSPEDIAMREACGQRFINNEEYGLISSPNYPGRYNSVPIICEWIIEVDKLYRIMLIFPYIAIEGEPITRGCSPAAVRVWTNMSGQPLEFCGQQSAINNGTMISTSNTMRIKFTTSEKAVGGDGFKAVWTKILRGSECNALHCSFNGYCVDQSLRCNAERNCGWNDNTDEIGCATAGAIDMYALLGIIFGSIFICLACLCVWCHRKAKRKREEEKKREHRQKSFCDATGLRMSNDSV